MAQNESGIPEWIQNMTEEQRREAYEKLTEALSEPPQQQPEVVASPPSKNNSAGTATLAVAAAALTIASLTPGVREHIALPPPPPSVSRGSENFFEKLKGLLPRRESPPRTTKAPVVVTKSETRPTSPATKAPEVKVVPTRQPEVKKPEKWTPRENAKFDDNGLVRIEPSPYKPGILDLSLKNPKTGKWDLYNNLVPVALVPGQDKDKPTNAELDLATPKRVIKTNNQGEKELIYEYSLSNGAKIDLKIHFDPGKQAVIVTSTKNPKSVPIVEYALWNSFGLVTGVDEIRVGSKSYPAGSHGLAADGHGRLGKFTDIHEGSIIEMFGKNIKQRQRLISTSGSKSVAMKEDRDKEWEAGQKGLKDAMAPNRPYTEVTAFEIQNLTSSTVEFSVSRIN